MTRFARARGSKSSNERQPEEATSWGEIQKQMLQQQSGSANNSKSASKQRTLRQQSEDDSKKVKWAAFEETPFPLVKNEIKQETMDEKVSGYQSDTESSKQTKLGEKKDRIHKVKLKKKKMLKTEKILAKKIKSGHLETDASIADITVTNVKKIPKKEKRIKKHRAENSNSPLDAQIGPTDSNSTKDSIGVGIIDNNGFKITKKQLKRKKHLQKKHRDDGFVSKLSANVSNMPSKEHGTGNLKREKVVPADELLLKEENTEVENSVTNQEPKLSKRQLQRIKTNMKKKLPDRKISVSTSNIKTNGEIVDSTNQVESINSKLSKRQKRNLKLKLKKPFSGSSLSKEGLENASGHKRRKPINFSEITIMEFNGQQIEVTMFDGFPVRRQDAEHLVDLRKKMIEKAVPLDEINIALKLERRKAEKALARERRKVCFQCRKAGHNLSECPNLEEGSNENAGTTGICFKCGSTEHTHFECRVNRGEEFRFAKCFICQEQGHISRQCPDNPRGLYPKGGACKVCGDVTHLKKACPDLQEGKELTAITLETSWGEKPEALEEDLKEENKRPANKNALNKIIKF